MSRALLIAIGWALGALIACSDFNEGDQVRALIQRDTADPCRLIITPYRHSGNQGVRSMTAIIEGCISEPRP